MLYRFQASDQASCEPPDSGAGCGFEDREDKTIDGIGI